MRKKKREERGPIPATISFQMIFIKEGLTEEKYLEEVRKIVRKWIAESLHKEEDEDDSGVFWEEYNEQVSDIIEEELARN